MQLRMLYKPAATRVGFMVKTSGYLVKPFLLLRFILFTNCINTIHWLAFVPLYLVSTDHKIRAVILAYSLSLSGIPNTRSGLSLHVFFFSRYMYVHTIIHINEINF